MFAHAYGIFVEFTCVFLLVLNLDYTKLKLRQILVWVWPLRSSQNCENPSLFNW